MRNFLTEDCRDAWIDTVLLNSRWGASLLGEWGVTKDIEHGQEIPRQRIVDLFDKENDDGIQLCFYWRVRKFTTTLVLSLTLYVQYMACTGYDIYRLLRCIVQQGSRGRNG